MAYPIAKHILPRLYLIWLRKVSGIGNVPKDKAFIIAPNHTSYYDAFLLPCILVRKVNRQFHAWVNSLYWSNPITKFFLDLWGGMPMYVEKEKGSKEKNMANFQKTLEYLKEGHIVMIFPEGKRGDGKLQRGYSGIARLALASKVPVLPVGITGANKVMPKGAAFPRFARCEVNIGKPMYFDKFYNKKDKSTYEHVTRSIMKEIAKLINQRYSY